jgi:archaellum component FlaC
LAVPLLLALGSVPGAPARAQSLAEIAEKEKAKKKDPKAKTFTNDDLEKRRPRPEASPTPSPGSRGARAPRSAPASEIPNVYEGMTPEEIEEAKKRGDTRGADGPAPDLAGAEAVWRKRAADARAAIEKAEKRVEELQAQYTALAQDLNPNPSDIGDPMRRFKLDEKKRETLAELEQAKADVTAKKKAFEDLEDEARRKNVPPGWLR